ncbi:hypothetical protein B0H63DRAFT_563758, partial [Podospora didyma]
SNPISQLFDVFALFLAHFALCVCPLSLGAWLLALGRSLSCLVDVALSHCNLPTQCTLSFFVHQQLISFPSTGRTIKLSSEDLPSPQSHRPPFCFFAQAPRSGLDLGNNRAQGDSRDHHLIRSFICTA